MLLIYDFSFLMDGSLQNVFFLPGIKNAFGTQQQVYEKYFFIANIADDFGVQFRKIADLVGRHDIDVYVALFRRAAIGVRAEQVYASCRHELQYRVPDVVYDRFYYHLAKIRFFLKSQIFFSVSGAIQMVALSGLVFAGAILSVGRCPTCKYFLIVFR